MYDASGRDVRTSPAMREMLSRYNSCPNEAEKRWFLESLPTDTRLRLEFLLN